MNLKPLILSGVLLTQVAAADVKISRETYRNWKDAIRVTNGSVDLVVVPQIGRILFYGETGKANMLFEDLNLDGSTPPSKEYRNYGGDKVWYAPQSLWNWPPDPSFDGRIHKAELLPDGVRLTSDIGLLFSLRVVREIRLKAFGTEVNILNRLQNVGQPIEVSCWQVTQVNDPSVVEMPIALGGALPAGFNIQMGSKLDPAFHTVQPGKLLIKRNPKGSHKFGARADGTLRANVGGKWFESFSKVERGGKFPDGGSAQEVYTNPDPAKYVELEHLSPLIRLESKQVILQRVRWRIAP